MTNQNSQSKAATAVAVENGKLFAVGVEVYVYLAEHVLWMLLFTITAPKWEHFQQR